MFDMGVGDYVTLSDDPTHYDLSNCPASMAMAQGEVEERSSKLESEWTAMEFGRTRSKIRPCERLPERIE